MNKYWVLAFVAPAIAMTGLATHFIAVSQVRDVQGVSSEDLRQIKVTLSEFTGHPFENMRGFHAVGGGGLERALAADIHNFAYEIRKVLVSRVGAVCTNNDGTFSAQLFEGKALSLTCNFRKDQHRLQLSKILIEGVGEIPVR